MEIVEGWYWIVGIQRGSMRRRIFLGGGGRERDICRTGALPGLPQNRLRKGGWGSRSNPWIRALFFLFRGGGGVCTGEVEDTSKPPRGELEGKEVHTTSQLFGGRPAGRDAVIHTSQNHM